MDDGSKFTFAYDFYYQWAAGRLIFDGRTIYDLDRLTNQLNEIGWPSWEGVEVIARPPWNLWLYPPVAMLPFSVAKLLWLSVIVAIIAGAAWWQYRSDAG